MTAFNYGRWVAKTVTNPKLNTDKKIFIVGPGGSGKSMTAVRLANIIAYWISMFNNGSPDHAKDYFTFDPDHIAIINTKDLIHVMTTKLKKNSIKIIDDCGASVGFTSRRSMSTENLDIASIYGTNRVQNGVTIYAVQDTTFTDVRMRKLANEVIDLTEWYQEGPFRIGKLYKIKMDKRSKTGIKECRFMTYEHGVWVTQESIACDLPDPESKRVYDDLRLAKEAENSKMINEKYTKMLDKENSEKERKRCPYCESTTLYYSVRNKNTKCRGCGRII